MMDLSSQEISMSTNETRSMICNCVNTLLTDLPSVGAQLSRETGASPQSETALEFCLHCVNALPFLYINNNDVAHGNLDRISIRSNKDETVNNMAVDFTKWLISRLLRVLSSKDCKPLHEKVIDVIHAIFQLYKSRDIVLYRCFTAELIELTRDLMTLMERFFLVKNSKYNGVKFYLDRFYRDGAEYKGTDDSSAEDAMYGKLIEIGTFSQCDLLLASCFKLLEKSAHGISQYSGPSMEILWNVIAFRLQVSTEIFPQEAIDLIFALLKTCGYIRSMILESTAKALLKCLEIAVDSSSEVERKNVELSQFEASLTGTFEYMFNHHSVSGKLPLSMTEIGNFFWKVIEWFSTTMLEKDQLKDLICNVGIVLLTACRADNCDMLIPGELLLHLSRCLISKIGLDSKSDVYTAFIISILKTVESGNASTPGTAKVAGLDYREWHSNESEAKVEVQDLLKEMLTVRLAEMSGNIELKSKEHKTDVKATVKNMEGIHSLLRLWLNERIDPAKDVAARLEKTATTICSLLFDPHLLKYSDEEKSAVINPVPRILNCIVILFNLAKIRLPDRHLHAMAEVAYLPWVDSIDPPLFDWKPRIHKERELRNIRSKLKSAMEEGFTPSAIQFVVQLQSSDHLLWKIHMLRSAMGSSNLEVQKAAVLSFPGFLATIGDASYCLLKEEVGPMIQSSRACIRNELAKICGTVACVLSGSCQLDFCVETGTNDIRRSCWKSYEVVCHTCKQDQLRSTISDFSLIKPFFQLLKQDSPRDVKLLFIKNLKQFMMHIAQEKEPSSISTILWTPLLNFMEDDDVIVRLAFSQAVDQFLVRKDLIHIHQLLFKKLKTIFRKASREGDAKMLETIVLTLGCLGKAAQGDFLLIVVISLLECLTTQHHSIGPVAYDQIHVVARHHKMKCCDLLLKFRSQVCEFLISHFRECIESGKNGSIEEVITETASVFDIKDSKTFLLDNQSLLLPRVMRYPDNVSSRILRIIAKQLDINRREMLFFNFKFIFSYLVRTCVGTELKKTLEFLENETNVQLDSLLLSECQNVCNQLLLYLSVSKDQVFTGLTILACNDAAYREPKEIKTNEEMAIFLKPRLLGVLAFFNFVLMYGDNDEKQLALQSLISLMQLMGPAHVTVVRLKIMAILRLGMKIEGSKMAELCCLGWNCFVRNVDLKTLGPLLGQILVTLFPFLDKFGDKVAAIFKFLIIENKSVMREFFKDVYYMPKNPVLKEVHDVIYSCHMVIKSKRDFRDQLSLATEGAMHENADVKKYALKRLADLLSEHQNYLLDFILSSESVHPVVIKLCNALKNSCKEADEDVRNLVGICFGHLGAVDPGRLEMSSDKSGGDFVIYQNGIHDQAFAIDMINELCRAFLAANDTRAQDCSAYAIQEVIQFYGCSDKNTNSFGYKLWQQFPEQTQEVLKPHLHSKYRHSSSNNWASLPQPIFGSPKGKSFKEWVCTWVGLLISKSHSQKDSAVLRPCTSIVKHDLKTAIFILPHAAFFAIMEGDKVVQEMLSEIDAVLQSVLKRDEGFATTSAQIIFSLLDYFHLWIQTAKQIRFKLNEQNCPAIFSEEIESKFQSFLDAISKKHLAEVAFCCKATPRALMYLESYIDNNDEKLQDNLEMLQRVYYALDEPDGISGVAAVRKVDVSLKEQILEHESSGRLRDAAACYEKAIQQEPNEVTHHQGLLHCLIRLGQLHTALMDASGIITKRGKWTTDILPFQSEAAWRLGQWDTLRESLDEVTEFDNWSISLGKLLVYVKDQRIDDLYKHLQLVRQEQIRPFSATGLDLGEKSYECIVRLHMLQEIEQFAALLMKRNSQDLRTGDLIKIWEQRYQATQASYRTREQILSLRRVLLDLLPSKSNTVIKEQDNCWIRIAKIARKAGHFQTSYSSLLNVHEASRTDTIIEKTKVLWSQGDRHKALVCLEKDANYIQSHNSSDDVGSGFSKQSIAKVLLLVGRWMEETESHEPQPILSQFKDVVNKCGDWEKGHFFLAKYYEKVMNAYEDKSKIKVTDFVQFIIRHYASSLQYGCKYIYQSMPTLLTLWLDFGVNAYNIEQDKDGVLPKKHIFRERLNDVNQIIKDFSKKLPAYQFLTAFSQIISRICHPSPSVWEIIQDIISRIFLAYKDQAFWTIAAVSKSSFRMRMDRCSQIFNRIGSMNKNMRQFIEHGLKLKERLLEVCNKPCRKDTKLTMSGDFSSLRRLLCDNNFSQIVIPLQSTMTVILPSGQVAQSNYNPFPDSLPTFSGIEETIDVLRSLQKPKKIVILGSDGKRYPMMCKPKDDLRKDCRLMEFNSLVNKLLLKDPECRRRQLHIRTYAVIPLSEECGLLEWVSNTTGLRQITDNLFKEKGVAMKVPELKRLYNYMTSSDMRTKIEVFKNKILPRHPPVFQEWFLRIFPNPSKWYLARLAYCRTTAVISMVGYILGLGDRHGENILFDSTTGDCFHVDFNCLFNKGESFDCPERVPFRLTQQLVSAMGPLGYEGVFRRSCEVTMKLMRTQKDSLLSVLNTFLYDPLVEWTKEKRKQSAETGETTNEKALSILRNVEDRLAGYCVSMKNIRLNLSIEGQVHQLIKEATNLENLSQMYIGWAAYL